MSVGSLPGYDLSVLDVECPFGAPLQTGVVEHYTLPPSTKLPGSRVTDAVQGTALPCGMPAGTQDFIQAAHERLADLTGKVTFSLLGLCFWCSDMPLKDLTWSFSTRTLLPGGLVMV